jgi:two-component system LytT family response regulator
MTIKTVVADDEPLARDRLRRLIAADQEFEIVHECRNGAEVLNTLLSRDVDLLMLDIHMPGLSGLDVVKEMGTRELPMIVFVTAHDKYAISAFEVNAVDYLLKPIETERFHEAIKRVKGRAQMKASLDTQERLTSVLTVLESIRVSANSSYTARFLVHSGSKDLFVNVDEIAWVEAADYYACLHVAGKKHLLRETDQEAGRRTRSEEVHSHSPFSNREYRLRPRNSPRRPLRRMGPFIERRARPHEYEWLAKASGCQQPAVSTANQPVQMRIHISTAKPSLCCRNHLSTSRSK